MKLLKNELFLSTGAESLRTLPAAMNVCRSTYRQYVVTTKVRTPMFLHTILEYELLVLVFPHRRDQDRGHENGIMIMIVTIIINIILHKYYVK